MSSQKVMDAICVVVGFSLITASMISYSLTARTGLIAILCGVLCMIPPLIRVAGLFTVPIPLTSVVVLALFMHCFGLLTDFYTTVGFYDTVTHTLSSLVVATCVFYGLMCVQYYSHGKVNFGGKTLAAFTAMISITFSVYWEVMEYFSDLFLGSSAQYGPYDTMTDLVCDSVGTLLASAWVGFYMRSHTLDEIVDSFNVSNMLKDLIYGH